MRISFEIQPSDHVSRPTIWISRITMFCGQPLNWIAFRSATNGQQMAASSERFHAPKDFPINITRNKQPDKQTNQPLGPQPSVVWITSRLFAGYPSSCCIAYFYISDIPLKPKTWHGTNGTKQKRTLREKTWSPLVSILVSEGVPVW